MNRIFSFVRANRYGNNPWHIGWKGQWPNPGETLCRGENFELWHECDDLPPDGKLCGHCRRELERRCRVKITDVARDGSMRLMLSDFHLAVLRTLREKPCTERELRDMLGDAWDPDEWREIIYKQRVTVGLYLDAIGKRPAVYALQGQGHIALREHDENEEGLNEGCS